MLCAISGTQTADPVVSPKSGGVFDRKLAQAYVATSGKDPLNDEPLAVEELIGISSGGLPVVSVPQPAEFHSIPTMLAAFQNEWDALALEVFTLRKQLHSTREELSMALYKYDAAVRVAAKAMREKEEAQQALQQIAETFASERGGENRNEENEGIEENGENGEIEGIKDNEQIEGIKEIKEPNETKENEEIKETNETKENEEIKETKDNKDSGAETFATVLAQAREALFALHKLQKLLLPVTAQTRVSVVRTEKSLGVSHPLRLTVNAASGEKILASETGTLCLPAGEQRAAFPAVVFLNEAGRSFAAGVNERGLEMLATGEKHAVALGDVRQVLAHPSEPYFVAVTCRDTWVFGGKNGIIHASESPGAIAAADIHVDGMLLGLAVPGRIDIVDLTSFSVVSAIAVADLKAVSRIHFAWNGYWLLVCGTTAAGRGQVRIYDLRKSSLVQTFQGSAEMEFAIDPACQVVLICDRATQRLHVHLYAKKGKTWAEDAHVEECGLLHGLQVASSPEDIRLKRTVTMAGLQDDKIVYLEMSLE